LRLFLDSRFLDFQKMPASLLPCDNLFSESL